MLTRPLWAFVFVFCLIGLSGCVDPAQFGFAAGSTPQKTAEPGVQTTSYRGLVVSAPSGFCFSKRLGGRALAALPCGALGKGGWPDVTGAVTLTVEPARSDFPDHAALAKLVSSQEGRSALTADQSKGTAKIREIWQQPDALYLYIDDPTARSFGQASSPHWQVIARVKTKWISLRVSGYNSARVSRSDGFGLAKQMIAALQTGNQGPQNILRLR